MRRTAGLAVLALTAVLIPSASHADVDVTPIAFTVTNPAEPGSSYQVNGSLYRPPGSPCADSVLLLLHGLSYGAWGWDFPVAGYSVARSLAARGYPSVAIDRLGYGTSPHPDGYALTVEAYGAITAQIVQALRTGSYANSSPSAFAHVGLMGHSAGAEITEYTAAVYRDVDLIIPTSYHHVPSQRIVTDFFTGDYIRAAQDDYEYFGGTEAGRTEYMYDVAHADPAVIAEDNRLANLTPSGEIFSIGPQPSRYVMATIDVPVLLVAAQNDLLFPVEFAEADLALFAGSPDASLYVVPDAGHSFMLHDNASQTNDVIADWLDAHASALPACA